MGRLSGFNYRDVTRRLKRLGFEFDRGARGSHEIRRHPETKARTTVPNHPGDHKQAGVSTDEFLAT